MYISLIFINQSISKLVALPQIHIQSSTLLLNTQLAELLMFAQAEAGTIEREPVKGGIWNNGITE